MEGKYIFQTQNFAGYLCMFRRDHDFGCIPSTGEHRTSYLSVSRKRTRRFTRLRQSVKVYNYTTVSLWAAADYLVINDTKKNFLSVLRAEASGQLFFNRFVFNNISISVLGYVSIIFIGGTSSSSFQPLCPAFKISYFRPQNSYV